MALCRRRRRPTYNLFVENYPKSSEPIIYRVSGNEQERSVTPRGPSHTQRVITRPFADPPKRVAKLFETITSSMSFRCRRDSCRNAIMS